MRLEGMGMGPRMREDNGRGTRGMSSCSCVHGARLFAGKTGGVGRRHDGGGGRCARNDIWETGILGPRMREDNGW